MFNGGLVLPAIEHFCPVPIVPELYRTPNKGTSYIRETSRRKAARMRLWARNFVMILREGGAADSLHISKAHPRKSAQKIRCHPTHAYYNGKPTKSGENVAEGEKFCDDFARRGVQLIVYISARLIHAKARKRSAHGRFRAAFRRLYSNFSTEMPASAKSLPANSSG